MPNGIAIAVFIFVPLVLGTLIEKWMKSKIVDFRRRWQNEQGTAKTIKGYVIAAVAIASFVGVALVANAFHNLGLGQAVTNGR
jgi:predicted Na+-dependent transporter